MASFYQNDQLVNTEGNKLYITYCGTELSRLVAGKELPEGFDNVNMMLLNSAKNYLLFQQERKLLTFLII